MILADVQVPALDMVYDFELEEERKVELLLMDILHLIARKEGLSVEGDCGIRLYGVRQERFLNKEKTLGQQGVETGDRLILV